jgi:RPA family protein
MVEVKRQTAYKCSIKMILEGTYVQRPGWDPNYILFNDLQMSRVNVLAVIVDREGNSLTLDDGTGKIQVMFFSEEQRFKDREVGEVVLVIGKPREYNQKRFIVPEIIKKIDDKKWIDYRRAELEMLGNTETKDSKVVSEKYEKIPEQKKQKIKQPEPEELQDVIDVAEPKTESGFEENYASIILTTIRKLDKGDGANINDIIKTSGLEKAEKYIISLINEGEIFEIRTGKIKILE